MPPLRCWNVLSWNVKDLNSEKKQLALNNAIISSGCAVVYLQETKMPDVSFAFIKTCFPKQFNRFAFVHSRGASGGLLTVWKSALFTDTIVFADVFVLTINFVSTQSSQSWSLVNIYGPCTGDDREVFTTWLYDVQIPNGQDWLLVGDFNYIFIPTNRNNLVETLMI